MDPEDYSLPQTTGKIRARSGYGGRMRARKPYLRQEAKKTSKEEPKSTTQQGFLSKVSSYIVPKWISGWFTSKEKKEPEEKPPSEDEAESSDEPETRKPAAMPINNQMAGNNVSPERTLKNLTSTPMVRGPVSFSVLRSDVSDPLEGTSTGTHKDQPTILDGRSLLSVDNNSDKNIAIGPASSRDERSDSHSTVKYQFSLGKNPTAQAPQRFSTLKRPSFKVSSFLSSSPLIPSGSSSAFYPGRTSYGGASSFQATAIKRQRMSPVAANVQTKKACIKPKSVSQSRMGAVTSDTARKILGALEKMSSPVHDASKLPNSPSSVLFNPITKRRSDLRFNQSSMRSVNRPPTDSLIAPNMFKIQQHATSKADHSQMFASKLPSVEARPSVSVGTFKSRGLPTSFSPEESKAGGKIKRQRQTSHFPSAAVDVEEEPVNKLPVIKQAVPLPVNSLPKFDFGPVAAKNKAVSETAAKNENTKVKESAKQEKATSGLFRFSQPEKVSGALGQKVTEPMKATFQFSAPFAKDKDTKKTEVPIVSNLKETSSASSVTAKNDNETKKDSNSSDVAVEEKKVEPNVKPAKSVANVWGQPKDQWECEMCMVRNDNSKTACSACETPRKSQSEPSKAQPNSLAGMFKPAAGSWECPMCMIQNKPETNKCAACEEKKPGFKVATSSTVGSSENKATTSNAFAKFAPKSGSWECEMCMVRNEETATACVSCTTPKPGATQPAKVSFGAVASGVSASGSVTFGTNVEVKFGSNTTSVAPTFGSDAKSGFSFGSKSISFGSNEAKGVKFGSNDSKAPVFGFAGNKGVSFGTNDAKGFSFGSTDGKGNTLGGKSSQNAPFDKTENKDTSKDNRSGGFNFGQSNKVELSKKDMKSEPIFGTSQNASPIVQNKLSNPKPEENNNKIFGTQAENALHTAVSTTAQPGANIFTAKQDVVKPFVADKPTSFPTIAQAAQSGFLKVPTVNDEVTEPIQKKTEPPKFSFGTVSNGPAPNPLAVERPKDSPSSGFLFSNTVSKSSTAGSFNFANAPGKTEANADSRNVFAQPSKGVLAADVTSKAGFSFGTPAVKSTSNEGSGNPVFAFGNSSSDQAVKPFSTTNAITATAPPQLAPQQNLFKFSNQQEPAKTMENSLPSAVSIFTKGLENQSGNNFSSPILFKSPENTANSFANSAATVPSTGFSFGGASVNSASGLSANPAAANNQPAALAGGFSFKASVPPVPDTNMFTENVAQTLLEPAKPFSFAMNNENSATPSAGGFQFGASKAFNTGTNLFAGANQPNLAASPAPPTAGFNFSNNTPSGGFNFTTNSNSSTPQFSSGTAPANRPIKKAVRRRK
eukprot:gene15909-17509_t